MPIDIDPSSLRRAWKLEELRFILKLDWRTDVPRLDQMVTIAEGIESRLNPGRGNRSRVESWVLTQSGWSGVMRNVAEIDDAMAWFELFRADWSRSASGEVVGAPQSVSRPHAPGVALSAFVRYTTVDLRPMEHNSRRRAWAVPEEVSRFLAEQTVAWTHMPGCSPYLGRGLGRRDWWISPVGDEVAPALADGMSGYTSCVFAYARKKSLPVRIAGFWTQGKTVYQYADPELGWRDRLQHLREILTWTPTHTDIAFIRHARTNNTAWPNGAVWPYVSEPMVRYNTPLLAMLVPDAHGIQVLTDAHLERAHNLSSWTITSLDGGRHLVESNDLAAWYSTPEPDPALLAAARVEFGEMIMTPENITANQVWPEGDAHRDLIKPSDT